MNPLGFAAGLGTALCWTFTSLCFEEAGRRMGSLALNLIRLVFALCFYVALSLVMTGNPVPVHASNDAWIWLSLSGLVGFVLGDIMLFEAFILVGARFSMLVYASSPVITAAIGFAFLGENISSLALLGIFLTVGGIALATLGRPEAVEPGDKRRYDPKHRTLGVLLALGGSVGQSLGLIMGKRGAAGMGSFEASEIRVIAGIAGFALIILFARKTGDVLKPFAMAFGGRHAVSPSSKDESGTETVSPQKHYRIGLGFATLGAAFGPFLGVSLGLLSAQLLTTGIASTLMAIVPVLAIPVAIVAFKERVTFLEIAGAFLAVGGVALLAF